MRGTVSKPGRTRRSAARGVAPGALVYWAATREPLNCLIFLLPLIAFYEIGALLTRPTSLVGGRLVAENVLNLMLEYLGATGMWLPGIVLVLSLLAWHFLARRPWCFRFHVPLLMAVESPIMAPPLYALGLLLLAQHPGVGIGDGAERELLERAVLAVGAGVYEEMVFRLMLLSGLLLLLTEAIRLPRMISTAVALAVSSILFALCHYYPVGSDVFEWRSFLMRSMAGVYLGAIYLYRGLGIASGTHVAYNLSLVFLWR